MSLKAIERVNTLRREVRRNRARLSDSDKASLSFSLKQLRESLAPVIEAVGEGGEASSEKEKYIRDLTAIRNRIKATMDIHLAEAAALASLSAIAINQAIDEGDAIGACNRIVANGVVAVADKASRTNLCQTLFAVEEVLDALTEKESLSP